MVGLGRIPLNSFKWFLLGCLICSCFVGGTTSQTCDPNDLLALKEFAGNLTNGSIISSWSHQSLCCEWEGVGCNKSGNGRVIVLNLSGKGLKGVISVSLSKLDQLELLNLSWNHLEGGLPLEVSNLKQLEVLDLSHNRLVGSVSRTLVGLSSIQFLNISGNSFEGDLFDLGEFPNLSVINASGNLFTGGLNYKSCSFSNNLRVLDVSMNRLTGGLNGLFYCNTSLQQLHVESNSLSGELPESLYLISSLEQFSISANNFSGQLSRNIILQECRNLTTLILTKNFIGEEIPENVTGFESLMIFALGNCAVRGQIPKWLQNCHNLRVLDLSWNQLDGSIPPWIGKMEKLFYLDFSNNSLTGEMPKSLTDLKSLISMNSSSFNLSTSTGFPLYVKRNQSLNGLPYNQASSFPPSILLSNNHLNGTIWPEIGKLKQLHVLDLSKNNISGTIPMSISDMSNLEVLDFSWNNLSGIIPASFNKLTFLSRFCVAYNHLHGAIPSGGQFLSFPGSSFEGNPGLCGTIDCPCHFGDNLGFRPAHPPGSNSKLGSGGILGITISIGVGIALLLAIILLRMSRRDGGDAIRDLDEEIGRSHRFSEAFGPSKLVIFQNSDCKDLTVADLLKSTSNFNQANIIGCGGFGLVYKASLPNGTKAAVKKLSGDCGQMEREFQAEVEALSKAQHKNLVSLQGYCQHGNDRLLIYSYMENGSLDYWLHERVDGGLILRWDTRLKIAQGAGYGLAYLHKEPNIIHRDIKTSNILLDEKFEAHLADFGLARLLRPYDTHVTTDLVGTLGYIPPEYSQTLTATFKGDVYSFGVVLLELITGRRPVEVCKGKNCRDLVSWVFQMKSEKREEEIFDSLIWDKNYEKQLLEVLGIACKCLDQDPRRRPSIDQVVSLLDGVGTEVKRE
ncbi:Non-specific serine/threonine protein kinase [Bertholletia excelsa]